ncbi:MAG: hypothetical protein WCG75_10215 [Armatimonadota bacterium]
MKKIITLVMVLSVLGGVLVGCSGAAANNDAGTTTGGSNAAPADTNKPA